MIDNQEEDVYRAYFMDWMVEFLRIAEDLNGYDMTDMHDRIRLADCFSESIEYYEDRSMIAHGLRCIRMVSHLAVD